MQPAGLARRSSSLAGAAVSRRPGACPPRAGRGSARVREAAAGAVEEAVVEEREGAAGAARAVAEEAEAEAGEAGAVPAEAEAASPRGAEHARSTQPITEWNRFGGASGRAS